MPAGGPRVWIAAVTLALALVMAACGGDDPPAANRAPTIDLTAGPMDGDSAAWNARFHWYGRDPDGYVDHYEYALDVPPDVIGRLEAGTDGGIEWTATPAIEGNFAFQTPQADSAHGTDGFPGPPTRWTGGHTFVVRAVDNDGARSAAEFAAFTALNYAPMTRVADLPAGNIFWLPVCTTRVDWRSIDPDSADGSIVGYDVKFKDVFQSVHWRRLDGPAIMAEMADVPWQPVGPDTPWYRATGHVGFTTLFAVRARDRAGAVESVFINRRNVFAAEGWPGGAGFLTVRAPYVGTFTLPVAGAGARIGTGTPLVFELTGDPRPLSSAVTGYNYGVDVEPDSDPDGPGWHGWSLGRVTEPIVFDMPGTHTITFLMRAEANCEGGEFTVGGTLSIQVVDFPMDREFLYIDDFRRPVTQGFTDATQDERTLAMLRAAGVAVDDPARFDRIDTFGPADRDSMPVPITAELLGRYRMVYWDVYGTVGNPALASAVCPARADVQAYLLGGGALWIAGQAVFGALGPVACEANRQYRYGVDPFGLEFIDRNFPCEFLKLCGGPFWHVTTNFARDGLAGASPTPAAAAEGYGDLVLDPAVFPGTTIPQADVLAAPLFGPGGLDSLYVYRTPRPSGLDGKPNAFRYHDPDPLPVQGPVAVFGFPMALMQPGSAGGPSGSHRTAALLVDWFRGQQRRYFESRGR
jgi:hypothetical protein